MTKPHLLLTRPCAEGKRTAAWLESAGFRVTLAPCLEIQTLPARIVEKPNAVLLTSQHAVPALQALELPASLPVFTVGPATARAVRTLGFTRVDEDADHAPALVARVQQSLPAPAGLLYLRGQDIRHDLTAVLTDAGYRVEDVIVYAAQAVMSLTSEAQQALQGGDLDGIVFYSARTVDIFAMLAAAAGFDARVRHLTALCISEAVAEAAHARGFTRTPIVPLQRGEAAVAALKTLFS
jgi:uroporphyrinogen-III synthase